ncbi:DUF839 domain-containing protein, partial [Streptomyces lunaelactis]|nr:DUF839 domain-containing protein [Streptomyces lunaelactis]
SCPDNLAFDSEGNLWISTDGQPGTIGYADALHKVTLDGAERGRVQQFLAVPRDAETCGPVIHDRDNSVFVNVQHPGEDGTWGEAIGEVLDQGEGDVDFLGADEEAGQHVAGVADGNSDLRVVHGEGVADAGVGAGQAAGAGHVAEAADVAGGVGGEDGGAGEAVADG